ncbi:DNA N-6-adenine-methyltransferase [Burkholderia gladioli]|uniref:DNA N-6-adenine-methyltransferase n=1 Tax=Burkholderia gladioli TaxID=28095 RepID=UPI00163E812C|nr:DNA N-6-adenine-methyltransferase [Burkholderia gladioli]
MSIAAYRFDNEKRRRPDHHARQAMLTPSYVLEPIRALLGGIDLDPCTEPGNPTQARQFYHLPMDGCLLPWNARTVFCNPPYGEVRNRWVEKCIDAHRAGSQVVLLIPAHTETQIFQRALSFAETVLLVKARLRFGVLRENGRQEAASHGSALFGFGVDLTPLSALGWVAKSAIKPEHADLFQGDTR